MGFVNVTGETTGKSLAETLLREIRGWGLDMNLCRSQTYDGAGNMAGHVNGAAALITKEYPLAEYIHCTSHW